MYITILVYLSKEETEIFLHSQKLFRYHRLTESLVHVLKQVPNQTELVTFLSAFLLQQRTRRVEGHVIFYKMEPVAVFLYNYNIIVKLMIY